MENISDSKLQILRLCIKPKTWTEIIELTGLSKTTIKSHIDRLVGENLLDKNENGYVTTSKGLELTTFEPHRRAYAASGKTASEVYNMINDAILPGLQLDERIKGMFAMGILRNLDGVKKIRLFLDDISKAIRDSVVVWLPKDLGLELDNKSYKVMNQIIAKQIKLAKKFEEKGRLQIIIDFDLPLALDNVINNEENYAIKQKLVENRDTILKTLYKQWSKITKRFVANVVNQDKK